MKVRTYKEYFCDGCGEMIWREDLGIKPLVDTPSNEVYTDMGKHSEQQCKAGKDPVSTKYKAKERALAERKRKRGK